MDIKNIDKNFELGGISQSRFDYYSIPNQNFSLYGLKYSEKSGFFRMDEEIAKQTNDGVMTLNYNTAGGRLKFLTDADEIELQVKFDGISNMSHMPLSGSSGFSLMRNENGNKILAATFMPDFKCDKGYTVAKPIGNGKLNEYTLYFPLYQSIFSLTVGLSHGAIVKKAEYTKNIKPILYYGSSITQGGCASRPDNSYQSFIEKENGIDYINLGFSGSAKAEDAMCQYLAGIDCSVFVCDYDHNAPNAAYLEKTHYKLYSIFRRSHKETPIIFISKPDYYRDDKRERFAVVQATYNKAVSDGDKNVFFIDGKDLFGEKDAQNCTVDGAHPTDLGFYKMANVIGGALKKILG